jgi:hypothetical protein
MPNALARDVRGCKGKGRETSPQRIRGQHGWNMALHWVPICTALVDVDIRAVGPRWNAEGTRFGWRDLHDGLASPEIAGAWCWESLHGIAKLKLCVMLLLLLFLLLL